MLTSAPKRLTPLATAAAFALAASYFTAYPALIPAMQEELQFSLRQLGILAGTFTIAYGAAQLPSGLLAFRINSYRVLLLGVTLMTLSAFLWTFSSDFTVIFIARVLGGIGAGTVLPASLALLSEGFKGRELVRSLGIFTAGWGLGIFAGMSVYSLLLLFLSWKTILLLSALAGIGVFVLVLSIVPRTARKPRPAPTQVLPSIGKMVVNRNLNLLGGINFAGVVALVGILTWLPLYLVRHFGSSPSVGSLVLALAGLAMFLGAPTGALIGNRFHTRIALVLSQTVGIVVLLLLGVSLLNKWLVIAVSMLLISSNALYWSPGQALIPRYVQAEEVSVAAGYYNTMGWLGTFMSTYLFALVVEMSEAFTLAFLTLTVFPVIGLVAACQVRIRPGEE